MVPNATKQAQIVCYLLLGWRQCALATLGCLWQPTSTLATPSTPRPQQTCVNEVSRSAVQNAGTRRVLQVTTGLDWTASPAQPTRPKHFTANKEQGGRWRLHSKALMAASFSVSKSEPQKASSAHNANKGSLPGTASKRWQARCLSAT